MSPIWRHILSSPSTRPRCLSTVARGTAFEERVKKILQNNLSMSLKRVGGKSDGGIDLMGWWWLPSTSSVPEQGSAHPRRRIRVLAQCKAEKKKSSPKYVRELEGVLHRYITLSRNDTSPTHSSDAIIGFLISESPFTKSTLLRAQSSLVPLFLVHIPPEAIHDSENTPEEDEKKHMGTAMWNQALGGARGLLQGEFEVRYERHLGGEAESGHPRLYHQGKPLPVWIPEMGEETLSMKEEDEYLQAAVLD